MKSPQGRILFITPQPFMAHRGSPLRVKATVETVVQLGYEVDLLAYPLGEDIDMPEVTLFRAPALLPVRSVKIGASLTKVVLDLLLFLKAFALVVRRRYVAVHGIEEAAFIAAIVARVARVPYFVDMHSSMVEQLRAQPSTNRPWLLNAFGKLFARCVRGASGVLTVCDELTNEIRGSFKTPAFTAMDLPLDACRNVSDAQVQELRKELGLENRRVLLYAGNLASYQGVELLIRAFAHLIKGSAPAAASLSLLVLGGAIEEEKTRREYVALAEELGVTASVVFRRAVPSAETGNYLALADVLVSPRLTGSNTPLKIYSYLVARRPIVATRISSHTQVLTDDCAYLCEPEVAALAQALWRPFENSPEAMQEREAKVSRASRIIDLRQWHLAFHKAIASLYTPVGASVELVEERFSLNASVNS
ncbi:MAG: glycosyltransferase [Bdellovibrionales bacterium]|nr:glycosyltransferase [Bdellovibrionales bacterium]